MTPPALDDGRALMNDQRLGTVLAERQLAGSSGEAIRGDESAARIGIRRSD